MKRWQVIVSVIMASLVVVAGFGGCTVVSYKQYAVKTENALQAQYKQNQNNYSNFTNSIVEMLQVADIQKDSVKEVVGATMQGRYGKNGSQAMFQWLKENNVAYDQTAFTKVVNRVEAGRKDFEQNQKVLLDMTAGYKTNTDPDNFPKGWVLSSLGFPRFNLDTLKMVMSSKTQETFTTGVDDAMELKPKR